MSKHQQKIVLGIKERAGPEVSTLLLSHCTCSDSNLKVVSLRIIFWMASSCWNIFYGFRRHVTLIVSKICKTSGSIRSSHLKWRFVFHTAFWDSLKPSQLIWFKICLPQNYYRQTASSREVSQTRQTFNFLRALIHTLITTTPILQ